MARKKHDGDMPEEGELYDPEPAPDERVEVEITAPHIYLPLDEAGNVPATWREAPDTLRVEKGTKLTMPPDCVEMLGDRVKASS